MAPFHADKQDPQEFLNVERHEAPSSIRLSEIISALSYSLDLTEGQPMGHSVRACMIGMRLAQQIGVSADEQADLYYALLLKDAGCSSNASRLFHILNADDIRAKGDVKTTDWTRVGYESLHYALTHVATGMPFLQRMQRLFQVAATQQQDSCTLVKIRCERGSYIAKQLGFSDSVSTGSANTKSLCSQESRIFRRRWMFFSQPKDPMPPWKPRRSAAAAGLIPIW
jgi:hypothetical protein